MEICVDGIGTTGVSADFEGFKFIEVDGTTQFLTASCPNPNQIVDLSQKRLIGFHVIVSDYLAGRRNIRAIAPIVD